MSIETSIDALTAQTSALLDVCAAINAGVTQKIASAVQVSTNTALVPLVTMATNLITTQALLVTFIARSPS